MKTTKSIALLLTGAAIGMGLAEQLLIITVFQISEAFNHRTEGGSLLG